MLKRLIPGAGVLAGVALAFALHAVAQAAKPPKDTMLSLPVAGNGPPVHAGKTEMNGYSLKDFPDFIKKWHFVTVRYRKDTGEMRLTYANDKAWEALLAGGKSYPDGATFAKIGIMTQEDPGFTSSVVPSGAKRYQLMVMDKKKHAATDGWGYALFDMEGKTFEQNPAEQVAACHACHKLVPERDYVFSQPMRLEIGVPAAMNSDSGSVLPDRITFVTKVIDTLPPKVKNAVPPGFNEARVIEGELAKSMFQGTIDEIRPVLTKEALRSRLPAVLVNEAGTRFSMAVVKENAPACNLPDGKKGVEIKATYTIKPGPEEKYPIRTLAYCEPPL